MRREETGYRAVRACGYVRVSTDEQAERGHSIGEQERLICEVAAL